MSAIMKGTEVIGGLITMNEFSTEEHAVGKWIDGRTIYEITVDCGALPNNTTKIVPTGSLGQDMFLFVQGFAIRSDKAVTRDLSEFSDLHWYVATTGINFVSSSDLSAYPYSYVTIKYVKS